MLRRTSSPMLLLSFTCATFALGFFAHAEQKKTPAHESAWELAQSARDTLLQIPAETRTRNDYTVVMDAYRTIYHSNPGDVKSPDAIFAVAGLLADEGRVLHNEKDLKNAIGQYEFLRQGYPRASLRIDSLYQEALIAQNDLHDNALAQEKFALFAKSYPKSDRAAEANAAVVALKSGRPLQPRVTAAQSGSAAAATLPQSGLPQSAPTQNSAVQTAPAQTTLAQATSAQTAAVPVSTDGPIAGPQHLAPPHKGKLATVSGIRHWSTPTYTRVAIDLGDDTQYEAARVPHPDRIFFDLHGTKLAPELVGKSFAVTDDGFLKKIRVAQFSDDVTRVVLDVNDVTEYSAFLLPNPYRLIIDIHGGPKNLVMDAESPKPATPAPTADDQLTRMLQPHSNEKPVTAVSSVPSTIALRSSGHDVARLSEQPNSQQATSGPTSRPIAEQVVGKAEVKAERKQRGKKVDVSEPAHVASPTLDGQRSLVRALGLKIGRIVIDAGHGGHDSGTLGAEGIMEKDVVLDVALRLGKMLNDRLGAEIIYTRSDDTFIPLETRTAIANKAQADLFISVHANSSNDSSARGVEVYYLNFTSQPDALDVAARENAVSDQSIHQLQDLVKKITLKDKIDESREFATDVDASLYSGLQSTGLRNRGVKKAPFVVLIGANMPSILAEISFVTNPTDAAKLKTPEYRQRVAESLYKGVAKYAQGLSGMRVAQASAGGHDGGR